MILLMAISLYTSRIILKILGVEDFGIYNIVGSIIVLFSFINNALSGASRRYLNCNINVTSISQQKNVFSTAFTAHIIISVAVFFLAEIIGVFLIDNTLKLPENRLIAAKTVYQFSVASAIIGILGAPFESCIISYEKMSIYSYIGIFEAISKLLIVYMVSIFEYDKLIIYSVLLFIVSILVSFFKYLYCLMNFEICTIKISKDLKLIKELLLFSWWSLLGQISVVGASAGLNIVLNYYLGVIINAAQGIAQQVNNTLYNFVSNFQLAFNPQLVKTYSKNELDSHKEIIIFSSKISFFLIYILSFPIILNISYILQLWLIEPPIMAAEITTLVIISTIIEAVGAPLWMSIQSVGRIKNYQLIISLLNALILPISICMLRNDMNVIYIYIGKIIICLLVNLYRLYYVIKLKNVDLEEYWMKVLRPISLIIIFSIIYILPINMYIENQILFFIITLFVSLIGNSISILLLGLTKDERKYIVSYFNTKFKGI